ncbi:hypothetical protein ACFQZ4_04270 [Catellatospora coxensis]
MESLTSTLDFSDVGIRPSTEPSTPGAILTSGRTRSARSTAIDMDSSHRSRSRGQDLIFATRPDSVSTVSSVLRQSYGSAGVSSPSSSTWWRYPHCFITS